MRLPLSFILAVAAFSQVGATEGCGGGVLRDPGFELWCGEALCSWKVVRGDVRQVPTWHTSDSGVELLGADAAISQLSPVSRSDGSCIRLEFVANVDQNVDARLVIDVYGDGTIDQSERLPTSNWKPLSYKIRIKGPYSGIRFELSKQGSGKAVFAQIAAEIEYDGCAGLPEIVPLPSPLGAWCTDDARCASGICDEVVGPLGPAYQCVGCTATTCGTNEVCGRGEPQSPVLQVPVVCVGVGSRELGEQCLEFEECASGLCLNATCSACSSTLNACTAGETCAPAYERGPFLCSPGQHLRTSNEPCATNSDCATNQCNGAVRKQCADGRACDSPEDCPVPESNGLEPGACTEVGVQGGRCQ